MSGRLSISFLAIMLVLSGFTDSFSQGQRRNAKAGSITIPVDWQKISLDSTLRNTFYDATKVDRQTYVSFNVNHFNYLRYNTEHEMQEEVLESYRVLEALWNQVFAIIGIFQTTAVDTPTVEDEFLTRLDKWGKALTLRERSLNKYLSEFPSSVALGQSTLDRLENKIEDETTGPDAIGVGAYNQLQQFETATREKILTSKNISAAIIGSIVTRNNNDKIISKTDTVVAQLISSQGASDAYYASILYEQQLKIHNQVMAKFEAFFEKGRQTYRGKKINFGKRESGTIVTTTFTVGAVDELFRNIANQEKPVSIEYFVQTDKPVIFHAGYSISSLNDVDFEKVQSLLGNDVFNLIRDEETSQDMSIFLTYEFLKSNDNQWSLGATLGTDVRLPGDKVYLGLSGKLFSSWFLTVAAATTELPAGIIPLPTTSGVISFESIRTSREWGFVVGLSVSPF